MVQSWSSTSLGSSAPPQPRIDPVSTVGGAGPIATGWLPYRPIGGIRGKRRLACERRRPQPARSPAEDADREPVEFTVIERSGLDGPRVSLRPSSSHRYGAGVILDVARQAPATVRRNVASLKAMFNAAVADDLIPRTPVRGIRLPRIEPKAHPELTGANRR